jgi:hypothetical protein
VVDESLIVRTLTTGHKGSCDDDDQVADKSGVVIIIKEGTNGGLSCRRSSGGERSSCDLAKEIANRKRVVIGYQLADKNRVLMMAIKERRENQVTMIAVKEPTETTL